MTPIKVSELDHIVLNVRDIGRSLKFYTEVLGLGGERLEEFKAGKVGFPSVRVNQDTIIDLSPKESATLARSSNGKLEGNLNHFCLVAQNVDLSKVVDYLKAQDVPVLNGPISRWGARGRATSVYLLDPDGNEIEIRCY